MSITPPLKFIFYSPNFYPMLGGVESVVLNLATELAKLGHLVTVVTKTSAQHPDAFPFCVVRHTSFFKTVQLIRESDVFVQFNISLSGIGAWVLTGRPLVATHHGLYQRRYLTGKLKWVVTRLATVNMGCSQFITHQVNRGQWLPNPYNESLFTAKSVDRSNSLVFLGRLVTEKGCDVLLMALKLLKETYSLLSNLLIIGDGPERETLYRLSATLGSSAQVTFVGNQTGATLAAMLNQHAILVVPSIYDEPFGLVALEGIACGCFVVGSRAGGLPEAIGPCGATFLPGDVAALAALLAKALNNPDWRTAHLAHAATHLAPHTRTAVASRFLTILENQL